MARRVHAVPSAQSCWRTGCRAAADWGDRMHGAVPIALLLSVAQLVPPAAWADPPAIPSETVNPAVTDACKQFNEALNLAAASYDEFAYASAGGGNTVNYTDQHVWTTNLVGRTALREAARSVLSASRTPDLPPEISDPMRSWSLKATKLLVVMGLRGGGDRLNSAANELNAEAQAGQMACALHGARA